MSEEMWFFLYLLEHYAEEKGANTGEVLQLWEQKEILQQIYDSYFIYHQEAIQNAYKDIDHLILTGEHAY